jgi:N-acyl-D-amino-acid deacylase
MRNEGTEIEAALGEAIRLASLLDMPLQISHLKIDSPRRWGSAADVLQIIDTARRRGLKVQADQYAYTAGSSSLSIRFPGWSLEGGSAAVVERLQSPETWARVRREMQAMLEERGFEDLSWATVANYAPDQSLNGLTMAKVAARLIGDRSADAQLEAARRLMIGGGASMVNHFMREDDIERIMRDPFVSIAADADAIEFGAGAPHPRGYGNNARVLAEYVRERQVLTLEEAVRRMTSLPARHFGLEDRGEIRTGAAADLVVFDAARIRDTATYARSHAYPEGVAAVLTNGILVVRGDAPTGARPGHVLRGK